MAVRFRQGSYVVRGRRLPWWEARVERGGESADLAGPDAAAFASERLSFQPDTAQQRVLRSTAQRLMVCSSRQWGKSTVAAIKALHHALRAPGGVVLLAASSERQAKTLLGIVQRFAAGLPGGLLRSRRSANEVVLGNGARIVALSACAADPRGATAGLLIVDEAAMTPDEAYRALRPSVAASGGGIWLLSSPHGRRGFFYEHWTGAGKDWERFSIPAPSCPRFDRRFLAEERRMLGEASFRQQYLCEFADEAGSLVAGDRLERLPGRAPAALFAGLDLGQQRDHTALAVVRRGRRRRREVVHLERFELGLSWKEMAAKVARRTHLLPAGGRISLAVDATGVGRPALEFLEEAKPSALIQPVVMTGGRTERVRSGVVSAPREELLRRLAGMLESGDLTFSRRIQDGILGQLREELASLRYDASSGGRHDDLAVALALALWMAR